MTIKDWLEQLAGDSLSTERDSLQMESILRRVGFNKARVTCGMVYLDGSGEPASIHAVAQAIVNKGGVR
uniref:Uncharacterized protein n=1 Tax=viral metagenome TaxID=1070528 RepID=A0A6M3KWB2_9ZZZZ